MTRDEASAIARGYLPKHGGDPRSMVAIPLEALEVLAGRSPTGRADTQVANVLAFGMRKHAAHRVEDGRSVGVRAHLAKAGKHLGRFLLGEQADRETGLHPLAHVAARVLLALETILREAH